MKPYLIAAGSVVALGFLCLIGYLAGSGGLPLLFPSGSIGTAERDLMLRATLLMLIVVVPVFVLIILIAVRYRAGNKKAKYTPDWEHSVMEEFIWWVIPFEIVLVLGALTWSSTHALAPERPLIGSQEPFTVQVVALPWKWLFIYPEEGVASVNELTLPAGRPIRFQITADAPMNSFWIPALGGQMYAMSGMVTELNLEVDRPGEYTGRSANYSGEGFARMTFTVHALESQEFAAWIAEAKRSPDALTRDAYASLAAPGAAGPAQEFGSVLLPFADIVGASMGMASDPDMDMDDMPGMDGAHH